MTAIFRPAARIISGMMLVAAAVASPELSLTSAAAQEAARGVENLGLRVPTPDAPSTDRSSPSGSNRIRPRMMPRTIAPGVAPGIGSVSDTPSGTGSVNLPPSAGTRALIEPVVATDTVGFFNSANVALNFSLTVAGAPRSIQLLPHQILTVQVDGDSEIKGSVGTGSTTASMTFKRGSIYVLRANADRWVFAAF